MSDRLSFDEVEARLRVTFQARSEDCVVAASNGHSRTPWKEQPRLRPLVELPAVPRRRTRAIVAVAAAVVVVVAAGIAIRLSGSAGSMEPTEDGSVTAGAREADSREVASGDGAACGSEPPVTFAVPGAVSGPVDGPALGGEPAEPGQLVMHWPRADDAVELRWPAGPKPLYELAGNRPEAGWAGMSASLDPARAEVDIVSSDGISPDVVLEGQTEQAAPCDVIEIAMITEAGRFRYGLDLTPGSDEAATAPYEPVDLAPLIVERQNVEEAPDAALACEGGGESEPPANPRGGEDRSMSGDEPADVLEAFVDEMTGVITSGYLEMIEPGGTVTYGIDPDGSGWVILVHVNHDDQGWYLEGWTASGC